MKVLSLNLEFLGLYYVIHRGASLLSSVREMKEDSATKKYVMGRRL